MIFKMCYFLENEVFWCIFVLFFASHISMTKTKHFRIMAKMEQVCLCVFFERCVRPNNQREYSCLPFSAQSKQEIKYMGKFIHNHCTYERRRTFFRLFLTHKFAAFVFGAAASVQKWPFLGGNYEYGVSVHIFNIHLLYFGIFLFPFRCPAVCFDTKRRHSR